MNLMRKKGLLILLFIITSLSLIIYLFSKPAFNYLSGYLSKSEKVKANILVVESWLPDFAFKIAYTEFQKNRYDYIITTGVKSFRVYYMLSRNGYLIFYPKQKLSGIIEAGKHTIAIQAYSELGGDNRA